MRWESDVKMDLLKINCEDWRWMKLSQNHVQWRALVLTVLNRRVPLPEFYHLCPTYLYSIVLTSSTSETTVAMASIGIDVSFPVTLWTATRLGTYTVWAYNIYKTSAGITIFFITLSELLNRLGQRSRFC
jgi:hypothetical protein